MGFLSSLGRIVFGETLESKVNRIAESNPFQTKLVKEVLELDSGIKIPVFSVYLKGFINSGLHTLTSEYAYIGVRLISEDEIDFDEHPVICSMKELQGEDMPFLSYVSDPLKAQYGLVGGWENWVRLLAVPLEALTFSRRSNLTVKASIRVFFKATRYALERKAFLRYYNETTGYLDAIEQRQKGKKLAVSLGVLVAGIDEVRDKAEAEIIKRFIMRQLAEIKDESSRSGLKQELNNAAKEAHAITSRAACKKRGVELAKEASDFDPDIKFQIMELLLEVAAADSVAAHHETEFLNELAYLMGLDIDEYKNMRDKALPISIYETNEEVAGRQVESMLGITDNMSSSEKKAKLSKEYRKWNALQSSSDPEKSKQAKEMVRAIGEIRKSL